MDTFVGFVWGNHHQTTVRLKSVKFVAVFLSLVCLGGCATEKRSDAEAAVLEISYFGGCAMAGRHCPRYVVYGDGQVEAQLVMPTGVETTKTTNIEVSLVTAALAEFAGQDLDVLAERFSVGCQSPFDGVDVELTLPTEAATMSCINLSGIADDVPAFEELVGAMVEGLDDDAGLLKQVLHASGSEGVVDSPWEGTVLAYQLPVGECHTCGFELTIDAAGSANYHRLGVDRRFTVEVDELRRLVTGTDASEIIVGVTDCGREVDGNAPILELWGHKIDFCYHEIDPDHELMTYLRQQLATGRNLLLINEPLQLSDHDDPWRYQQLLEDGPTLAWTESFSPDECPAGSAILSLPFGSARFASEPVEGGCDLWLGGETEDPLYNGRPTMFCRLPTGHETLNIVIGDGGPAQINSLWCDVNPVAPETGD